MSIRRDVEPLSDHPLFRALILMGGSLAIGCGGVAERERSVNQDSSSAGMTSAGAAAGGALATTTPVAGAGAPSAAGASGADGSSTRPGADYNPSCPYEQWDCSALVADGACYLSLPSKDDPRAAGCRCDTSRPTSAAACKSDESFVCRQGFPLYVEGQLGPSTWDGTLHVQCACLPTPQPGRENCNATCYSAFNTTATGWPPMHCYTADYTCDSNDVCTATSADVLRQEGIMCGCADIGLK